MTWTGWADHECRRVAAAGQWRAVPRDDDATPSTTFASNDYLGLSQHPAVIDAAHAALDRWGAGAGSARLVAGARSVHAELEAELADWKGTEAALLFPTGYAANLGVLTTFGPAGARILSDERNHASIVDGCRLARAGVEVYAHADLSHVTDLLAAGSADTSARPTVVVTDTVFSMDGDVAPVDKLARLCADHGALLVLDEAHAVLGPHPDLEGVEHLRVGTLSKTLGSVGGFVAGSRRFVELLVNRARSFIFTTAPAPADTAAALAALRILRSDEGEGLVDRLRAHVTTVAGPAHPSPILAVILGEEQAALDASAALAAQGLIVPAIRPPTVAPGTSRLRVSLSAAHTDEQVARLTEALRALPS
ncbi:MAG: 8-amino-7-oxononanoate synthase [Actinomycetota bacterium]|jgi:8-amino-7-oxononanoate synthase|nr:8-amino-7-oxononanoate synthase [Actinomycetota bacterium]